MERSDCRLYSGPLSLEAQKILEALQAQKRQATRQIHRYYKHYPPLENGRYGSQWEPLSQSYTSQQQERNPQQSSTCYNSQWSDSGPLAYSQSSQTRDFSQASCSSWEPSLRSRTNPSGPDYQVSQMYSQRNGCGPPALQSSQALPFSQTDACSSQVDRYSLTLQTPQGLSEHPIEARERSEEMTPQFTIEFPSDDETPGPKVMTEPLFPSCLEMTSLVKNKRPPADRDLPKKESFYQHQPTTPIRLNHSLEKELKCGLHLNKMLRDAPEESKEVEEKTQEVYTDTKWDVPVELEDALLPCNQSNPVTFFEATSDLTHEHQPECCDVTKTSEIPNVMQSDSSDVLPISADADEGNTAESEDVMEVESELTAVKRNDDVQVEALPESCSSGKLGKESDDTNREFPLADKKPTVATINNSQSSSLQLEVSHCPAPVIPHVSHDNTLTNPAVGEEKAHLHLVNTNTSPRSEQSDSKRNKFKDVEESTMTSSSSHGYISSSAAPSEGSRILPSSVPHHSYSKPSFISLKRKYEALQSQSDNNISSKAGSAKRPLKWKPPQSSQEQKREATKEIDHSKSENSLEGKPRSNKPVREVARHASSSDCTPPKISKYISKHNKPAPEIRPPGFDRNEVRNVFKPGSLTSCLTSDPRVADASKMNKEEMDCIVKKAQTSEAVVLTLVFRDGTTQLDPEQKLTPPVCGLLLLMKTGLDNVSETLGPNDRLVYFKLEHAPAWAQQPTPHRQQTVTRELLLHVFLGSQLLVCYKAKDVLRVILQLYNRELTWKQVVGCQLHDPQVSGWLLDPGDPASCFQDLLNKHCRIPRTTPALGSKKVSQIIAGLCSLYKLNRELGSKLQSQGLWGLYSGMELKMIPVLAAMEVCHIHVDKEALRRTSELLGTKMRQLEQEAHKAAGQKFLLTSSTQLRTVLFEKLRLHERCENKKLPKTINKQQSTSEAALLQLQDLHPLPKIILEYRQIHKIKSTFVDGILSCMMTKSYISSTWHQTSVVTGRISAKHPNFQALPRQPLQVTRTLYIAGKDEELVTVHPRAMFIPKEGWTFLSADFCQVELRLLAHLSSDPELLRVFTSPEADVFSMLASQWKGVNETEVTSEDREHAKRIVYSVVYGAGSERLSGILGVNTEQARRFQDSFLQTYKEVQTFIQKTVTECQNKGYVLSIMGRRRSLHNINSPDWGVRMQAERQAVNFVVQGSAADLCKMAMIRIFNLLSTSSSLSARLVAQLHDELLYEVEDSQLEEFAAVVKSTMESLARIDQLGVRLKVPLKVAVSSGKSWGSMSELGVPRDVLLK